jgi:hypothetical protein
MSGPGARMQVLAAIKSMVGLNEGVGAFNSSITVSWKLYNWAVAKLHLRGFVWTSWQQ